MSAKEETIQIKLVTDEERECLYYHGICEDIPKNWNECEYQKNRINAMMR